MVSEGPREEGDSVSFAEGESERGTSEGESLSRAGVSIGEAISFPDEIVSDGEGSLETMLEGEISDGTLSDETMTEGASLNGERSVGGIILPLVGGLRLDPLDGD